MILSVTKSSPIKRTARVAQIEGMFDMSQAASVSESWDMQVDLPKEWNVGVIVGPSGAGKSTVARELFGDVLAGSVPGYIWDWPADSAVIDGFPQRLSIKDITDVLSSVGFSSPPSWRKPFSVLSTGEKFRVELARTITEMPDIAAVDEFTSVIDRTVAQVGSAAIAKTVRRRDSKLVAVTCHYDVLDWLEPDWILEPHTGQFQAGRSLRQRPKLNLTIRKVDKSAWEIFKKHHYLDANIAMNAACFVAFLGEAPVAIAAVIHFMHPNVKNFKKLHRLVCLPDYQGLGIGNRLADCIASACAGLGFRFISQSAHPAMLRYCNRSASWVVTKMPKLQAPSKTRLSSWEFNLTRPMASFEYCGPKMNAVEADTLWNGR